MVVKNDFFDLDPFFRPKNGFLTKFRSKAVDLQLFKENRQRYVKKLFLCKKSF